MHEDILAKIVSIVREKGFFLSSHASRRMIARRMNFSMVEDVLLNPHRVVRVDEKNDTVYKIQGGKRNRKLAVVIRENGVLVVTIM